MRNRLEVIGLIVTLFISGITLLNWWPKEIGYASLVIAFILCIHLSFEEGKSRGRKELLKGLEIEEGKGHIVFVVKEGDKKELKRQSWGGFTRAEASELRAALQS